MADWHEPTEIETLEHLRDVLASEVADGWILPLAFLYPADNDLGDGPNPIETRRTLAELRDLACAVSAYGVQGWAWPSEVNHAFRAAERAGFSIMGDHSETKTTS